MNATATVVPVGPQYMRALELANKVRLARAKLKRSVRAGEVGVAEIIEQCPWEVDSMPLAELLMSQRRWGQTRCLKLLAQVPISQRKTVGSMTDRQRRAVASMLSSADGAWGETSVAPPTHPRTEGVHTRDRAGGRDSF
jgi:hypothetical protein